MRLAAAAILVSVAACKPSVPEGSEGKTDLGATGNKNLTAIFNGYKAKGSGYCPSSSTAEKRVIITGFGPFSSGQVVNNVSGVVAASMANTSFWPATATLSSVTEANNAAPSDGRVSESDKGGKATYRTLTIKGTDSNESLEVGVCFLTLDVLWDLASAIIITEAERFQPDLIIMGGRGNATIFEGGAINNASSGSGFDHNGTAAANTSPINSKILPDKLTDIPAAKLERVTDQQKATYAAPAERPMTWDNEGFLAATKDLIQKELNFSATAAPAARPSNNYICNNTSYMVLSAAAGVKVLPMLGGELTLTPENMPSAKAGFFHYHPDTNTSNAKQIFAWNKVLAKVLLKHYGVQDDSGATGGGTGGTTTGGTTTGQGTGGTATGQGTGGTANGQGTGTDTGTGDEGTGT